MKFRYFFPILICLLITFNSAHSQQNTLFSKEIFYSQKGDSLLYRFLIPQNISANDSNTKYPLVVFLHGAGERGNDNVKQLIHGASLFSKPESLKNYPCYFIAPQCPIDKRWVEVDWKLQFHSMPEQISENLGFTVQLIDSLIKNYPIDINRIYVTGLSMGGFGTWDIICRFPDKFAAAAPICGGGDENLAEKINKIPIWAFHGSNDKLVTVYRSRNMINALKKTGGKPKYTEYPGVGHFSWEKAYSEPDFLKWMFSQSKIIKN